MSSNPSRKFIGEAPFVVLYCIHHSEGEESQGGLLDSPRVALKWNGLGESAMGFSFRGTQGESVSSC